MNACDSDQRVSCLGLSRCCNECVRCLCNVESGQVVVFHLSPFFCESLNGIKSPEVEKSVAWSPCVLVICGALMVLIAVSSPRFDSE